MVKRIYGVKVYLWLARGAWGCQKMHDELRLELKCGCENEVVVGLLVAQ